MGREQLAALARIIEEQIAAGVETPVIGTWTIHFDAEKSLLYFDKCEFGAYCEERPTVIALDGQIVDRGGPILIGAE